MGQSGMDLSSVGDVTQREDEGQLVHIKDAKGEDLFYENGNGPKAVTIRVAGSYSSFYRRAQDANRDRMMKRGKMPKGEEVEQRQLNLAVACILGWEGFTNGGADFPHTKQNAELLLTKAPWIREQVEEAMFDHQGFLKPSSST